MTAKQAVYQCFFCYRGDRYEELIEQIAYSEKATGNVLFCTFPGLNHLMIRGDMEMEFVNVVKASVKLEGVFGTRSILRKKIPVINIWHVNKRGHDESAVPVAGAEGAVSNDMSLAQV